MSEKTSAARKLAVHTAVSQLNEVARTRLSPEQIPGKTLLWRVLVEPLEPKKHSDGGIELPEEVIRGEEILTKVGRVLQVGHFAFKAKTTAGLDLAEEPNVPGVGDYVMFEIYAGQEFRLRSGARLRLLTDTEILMLVTDPDQIVAYR